MTTIRRSLIGVGIATVVAFAALVAQQGGSGPGGGGGGSGTVTSVATGTGLTGGPITTNGTISLASAWQSLQTATVTLTNTQVNSLTASCANQITLLPAPGAGYWLRVTDVSVIYTYGSLPFVATSTAFELGWSNSPTTYGFSSSLSGAGFLDQVTSQIMDQDNSASAMTFSAGSQPLSALDNQPFAICNESAAQTTAGTGSTLTFNILYRIEAD